MATKVTFSASRVGSCTRVLSAGLLGYAPTPTPPEQLRYIQAAKDSSRWESLVKEDLRDLGYKFDIGGYCPACGRDGIHVQLEYPLFTLIGHLDGQMTGEGWGGPLEIKALNSNGWSKYLSKGLDGFPEYRDQYTAYWAARKDPRKGLYAVKSKNTSELDIKEMTAPPGNIDAIIERLTYTAAMVRAGKLALGEESDKCWFCRFKYLCAKDDSNTTADTSRVPKLDSTEMVKAASMWREAANLESRAERLHNEARDTFLSAGLSRFEVDSLDISIETRTRISYPIEELRKWVPEDALGKAKRVREYREVRAIERKAQNGNS